MTIVLFSPPPVGLTSADDVTEGFPLDLSVPHRAFQGNHRCMLDKTSKTLVKLIFMQRGRAFVINECLPMALDCCVHL